VSALGQAVLTGFLEVRKFSIYILLPYIIHPRFISSRETQGKQTSQQELKVWVLHSALGSQICWVASVYWKVRSWNKCCHQGEIQGLWKPIRNRSLCPGNVSQDRCRQAHCKSVPSGKSILFPVLVSFINKLESGLPSKYTDAKSQAARMGRLIPTLV